MFGVACDADLLWEKIYYTLSSWPRSVAVTLPKLRYTAVVGDLPLGFTKTAIGTVVGCLCNGDETAILF